MPSFLYLNSLTNPRKNHIYVSAFSKLAVLRKHIIEKKKVKQKIGKYPLLYSKFSTHINITSDKYTEDDDYYYYYYYYILLQEMRVVHKNYRIKKLYKKYILYKRTSVG